MSLFLFCYNQMLPNFKPQCQIIENKNKLHDKNYNKDYGVTSSCVYLLNFAVVKFCYILLRTYSRGLFPRIIFVGFESVIHTTC